MLFFFLFLFTKKSEKNKDDNESESKNTSRATPVSGHIQSLYFRKNSKGELFADLLFYKATNPMQILLMQSPTREEDSFMWSGNLRDNARFRNGGTEVTIKFPKISKQNLKKYFYCLHFYLPNKKYFSTEIFTYNNSSGVFEINRGGTNHWFIFGVILAVFIIIIICIAVYMRMGGGNRPIEEPEEDL